VVFVKKKLQMKNSFVTSGGQEGFNFLDYELATLFSCLVKERCRVKIISLILSEEQNIVC
jgi:hypothetical protein